MKHILLISIVSIYSMIQPVFGQFTPGIPVFDQTGYVEYTPGNVPVIISSPHGGYLEPASIPDRSCNGCVYGRDSYTQELTRSMQKAFYEQTGCYPHVVINLLHRKKFDANRDIGDAADGDPIVEQAWNGYHEFLDSAKSKVVANYGRGVFLDMHGHGHSVQRLELGYLLSKSELQLDDSVLNQNAYVQKSSIQTLVGDNIQSLTHAELLRGANSFGTLLENKSIPAVPSSPDPSPLGNESYFNGGYNTKRHGSFYGGAIDGIQIECHQDIRFDSLTRENFADSLVVSINEFMRLHYNNQYVNSYCNSISSINTILDYRDINIYPNPVKSELNIIGLKPGTKLVLFNTIGEKVASYILDVATINMESIKRGYYFLYIEEESKIIKVVRVVKQ